MPSEDRFEDCQARLLTGSFTHSFICSIVRSLIDWFIQLTPVWGGGGASTVNSWEGDGWAEGECVRPGDLRRPSSGTSLWHHRPPPDPFYCIAPRPPTGFYFLSCGSRRAPTQKAAHPGGPTDPCLAECGHLLLLQWNEYH